MSVSTSSSLKLALDGSIIVSTPPLCALNSLIIGSSVKSTLVEAYAIKFRAGIDDNQSPLDGYLYFAIRQDHAASSSFTTESADTHTRHWPRIVSRGSSTSRRRLAWSLPTGYPTLRVSSLRRERLSTTRVSWVPSGVSNPTTTSFGCSPSRIRLTFTRSMLPYLSPRLRTYQERYIHIVGLNLPFDNTGMAKSRQGIATLPLYPNFCCPQHRTGPSPACPANGAYDRANGGSARSFDQGCRAVLR